MRMEHDRQDSDRDRREDDDSYRARLEEMYAALGDCPDAD